jgi:hypothetical protein
MSRTPKKRGARVRVALASATAAFAACAFWASAASADTITLDHGFLKISGLEAPQEIIDTTTGPVVLSGVTYDGGGNFSVTTGNFAFPTFSGTVSGVPLTVDVNPLATMNGNYNSASGVLTTSATNFEAIITLGPPVNATCQITPIPLSMSTANNAVFLGDVFTAGPPPLTGPVNGAISDDWATLPPDPDAECGLINGLTAGPGGLWLSNGIATPSFPAPAVPTPPATTPKKCKKKKKKGKKGASAAAKCKKKKKKKK